METQRRIQGYLLILAAWMWATGCLSAPSGERPEDTFETDFSEQLFRYLMAEAGLVDSRHKACLSFGNPLKTPSARFQSRFHDLDERLIGLQEIHRQGPEMGYRDRESGSPIIFFQIIRMIRLGQNVSIMEAGWIRCRGHSRRCLYEVTLEDTGCHIREVRVFDRCQYVIASQKGTAGLRFFSRRLAF